MGRAWALSYPVAQRRLLRQFKNEGRTVAGFALDPDAPAVRSHDVSYDGQTQAHALGFAAQFRAATMKAFEDPCLFLPRDARTGIGNGDTERRRWHR